MHCAKFINLELSILHPGAALHVKERTRRLQSLRDENDRCHDRKDNEHDRQRDRDVDRALEKSVQWIFQRFFAQSNETEAAVFKVRHGMTQSFFQIAQNKKANAEVIANLDDVLIRFGKEREFKENDLTDFVIANDLFELGESTEQRNSRIVDFIVVGNQANRS